MSSDLKDKTVKALMWSFIEKFGQQVLYIITGMIVARIVTPREYGQIGVLMIFISLSTILSDSGFSLTLTRKKDVEDKEYSTVFIFNLLISIGAYLILFFCAPLIAGYFEIPQLKIISRVLFLSVIFYSLSIVQNVMLTRKLDFKLLGKINLISLFLSSILSVTLAVCGFGVWALVAQYLGLAIFRAIFLWIFGEWKVSARFEFSIIKGFFNYSSKLMLVSTLNAIANNIYSIVIGKCYNSADVGYYTQANKYQEIPSNMINNSFRPVIFPVLSKVEEDEERRTRVLSRIISTLGLIIFPVMFMLTVVAEPLIVLLISDVWLPSVEIFRILCIAGAFMPFALLLGESFAALGSSNRTLIYEGTRKVLLFIGIFFVAEKGINDLAWLWVGYMVLSLLLVLFIMRRFITYSYSDFLKDIWMPLLFSGIITCFGFSMPNIVENIFIDGFFRLVLMSGLYISLLYVFKNKAFLEALKYGKDKLGK